MASGRKDAPITIESYPGERAILDGSNIHWSEDASVSSPTLLKLRDVDWYVVRNLTLRNSAGRALYFRGNHNTVQNVESYDHHSDGVYLSGSYNLLEGIESHGNYSEQNGGNSADGIKISYGNGNVVRNCRLYNNSDDGIDVIYTTNTLVEHCVAYGNGRGYSGNGDGFKMGGQPSSSAASADSGNIARYNLAWNNRQNNFDTNGGGGILMVHNTSLNGGERGFVLKAGSDAEPNIGRNNISYNDPDHSFGSRDILEANSWNLKISDPKFLSLDPASPDFLKLASGSPAVDAGMEVGLSYAGTAPDLGALELGESVASLVDLWASN